MLQDTLIRRALDTDKLSYGDPATRAAYLDHNYNGDKPADALSMGATQDSCLLAIRGLLAHDEVNGIASYRGTKMDVLHCAYKAYIGQIDGLLLALAEQHKLVKQGTALVPPELADVLIIGHGGSLPPPGPAREQHLATWGGTMHGLFVVGVTKLKNGSYEVGSVDGGQPDEQNIDPRTGRPRNTAIRCVSRVLSRRADGWWLGSRKVNWGFSAAALPLVKG